MKQSYTVKELATRWGCHPRTIYRLIQRGVLPSFRVGVTRRVRTEDIEAHEKKCDSRELPRTT